MQHERLSLLTLLAVLTLPSLAGASAALEPLPSSNDNYGESFTFMVDLEDGTFVFTQFSITNLGPGSRHGICRATVVRPGQKTWAPQVKVDSDEWGYDAATSTLKMGPCTLHAGSGTFISLPLDNGLLNITFSDAPAPKSPPGSEVIVGNARYRHEVLLPFSAAKVSLRMPKSNALLELSGKGYGDHSHSTVAPAKLARSWVRFRALRDTPNLLLLAREGFDGGFSPAYLWPAGGEPQGLERFSLRRQEGDSKKAGWEADLNGAGGTLLLRSTSLLLRNAPVQDLGLLGSLVRPVVGSPVTYLMRAVLQRPGQPDVKGLMEVTLDEG
ncbi:hypothetical protein [Hyalangium sp.]|uniref:hypothetical protein n=1 Tax=Hyalangium sp. TaxID=2028555 RepID=UPI002D487B48|nr:hypothetical protein [Hyalangium sp.]HYH98728.1 hypothetical protein [Hyalangium sp.]